MSSNLYWLPPPKEQVRNDIGYLKYEIGRYYDSDYNGEGFERTVGKELIPFLKGIIAVGGEKQAQDAAKLIVAIEYYGEVQLINGW